MSNRRSICYLLLLLLAAVGANWWLDVTGSEHAEMVRRRSLVQNADTAVAIELAASEGAPVRLERSDRWRMVLPFRAVADQSAVDRLTDALAFAPLVESVDETDLVRLDKTYADFGLDSPRLSLKVVTRTGETSVAFGAAAPSGEGVYAAVSGVSAVYIVPHETFAKVNLTADAWRRRTVFSLSPDAVTSIDIRRGANGVRLVRNGEGWEVADARRTQASAPAVKRIIDTVLSCEAQRFVWPIGASNETVTASVALLAGYGLDSESCETVVFRTDDGRDHSISFGAAADTNMVYALVHAGTAVATVTSEAKASVALDVGTLIDGRLFPLEKTSVQRISLLDGEIAYLLARDADGRWRLDSPVAAAADETAVASLLDKLLVMRGADLDENGVKVALVSNAVPVSVSRSALLGEGGFEQLRSKVILDIDSATVKRLVISRAGDAKPQAVVFDPDRRGWNVDANGRPGVVDSERVNAVLAALSPLKAKAVARIKVAPGELARYGLETPACTIAIDRLLEDSVRRNILLGNTIDITGDTYATVGSSDAVFVLDVATVKTLVLGVLEE